MKHHVVGMSTDHPYILRSKTRSIDHPSQSSSVTIDITRYAFTTTEPAGAYIQSLHLH